MAHITLPEEYPIDHEQPMVSGGAEETATIDAVGHRIKTALQTAVVAGEITPANEALRLTIFGMGEAYSHSPAMGALTLGLSTLAIEGAGAMASASLLASETNQRLNTFLRENMKKRGYNEDQKFSPVTKIGTTFLGGSVVGMGVDKFENPEMTTQDLRKDGLIKATWLAGVCAVGGAAGSKGIELLFEEPKTSAVVAAGIAVAGIARKVKNVIGREVPLPVAETISDGNVWFDTDKYGNRYGILKDPEDLRKAADLEQMVWTEKSFGDLEEEGYLPYIAKSRTFAAFSGDECIGMNRMFVGDETIVPPFLEMEKPEEMGGGPVEYFDEAERSKIAEQARAGEVEELGTVAVDMSHRGKGINLRLWRLAYRDAAARGIKSWGIIMEPERVEKLNKHNGFTFKQISEAVPYQGGDCAAFIMDLEDVDQSMRKHHPLKHFWFVGKKLAAPSPEE
jgi:hypothetical protein